MPFVLLIVGVILLVAGVRGKEHELFALLKDDFVGAGGFVWWILVLAILGGIGYIKRLQPISVAFMALVLIVFFIRQGSPLQNLISQISASTSTPTATQTAEVTPAGYTVTNSTGPSSSGGGSVLDAGLSALTNSLEQQGANLLRSI